MTPTPDLDEPLLERWAALCGFLQRYRPYWEPAPFLGFPVGWEVSQPELADWLSGLSESEIDRLELNFEAVLHTPGAPAFLTDLVAALEPACAVPAWPTTSLDLPARERLVPARKVEQIRHFVEAVLPGLPATGPVVDWCAGKGHLGRTLALASGLDTVALERDEALVLAGATLARSVGAPSTFRQGDATTPAGQAVLDGATGAVALHACGHLGDHLLASGAERGLGFLALAPCCYWRLGGPEFYNPRSQAGRDADLRLDLSRLRLACHEERTGTPRQFAERRRRMAWRLGLDLLNRRVTGVTRYTTPPVGFRDLLTLPFADFCTQTAARVGLALPPVWDPAQAEAEAWALVRKVRAFGLVRAPFRRALELWLVLDRALALREAGYAVGLGTFCSDALTPRNLLLVARRGP